MKALISSIESVETGFRVAQVEQDSNTFPVAEGMFWVDCSDEIVADQFWYDPLDKTIKVSALASKQQPTVDGAEQL